MSTSPNPIESSGVRRASRGPTKVFKGHTAWVRCAAYFPDGRCIASASDDKTVIIWDVESSLQYGQPLQHHSAVMWIAISPDGRRIASGLEEGGFVIWDALTREVVHEIKMSGVEKLAYSPDGRWIATALVNAVREVQLWDADTGRLSRELLICNSNIRCMAFSPDGLRIAAGTADGSFQVLDIATGEVVLGPIKGHTEFVWSIVYSPDGRLLLTASRDSSIRFWDSKTGIQVGKPMFGHKYGVNCISIAANGRRIASRGIDGTVRVWDLETRLQVGGSFDADGWVFSLAFSPDGRYIISGGYNGVFLWDTESFTIQGPSSPPTATTRIPPQRQVRAKSHNDTSSTISSLLDLPAVVQQQPANPQERKPSVDDDWDFESIRPRLRPTEPQQHPPLKQETPAVDPATSGRKWSRNIREHWAHIWHRKPRVQTNLSDCPPHPPIPLHERVNFPASPEFRTNQQARQEKVADTHEKAQGSHSRTRPSKNQIEANVAFAQDDVRLVIAAPRGRKGRRFRARAQRGGVRANSHSDTESEDSDAESEYVDTGCLDAVCFGEYFRRRRYLQGR